jgi:PTS hybrid protein
MADIFSAHALLLGDEELVQAMETRITVDQQNAESALYDELMVMANAYLAMEDSYLRVRELDVRDILQRALRHLQDQSPQLPVIAEPCILVADELFPSQVIALSQPHVKAICLAQGSVLSHSAILARAAAIPMMVAADKVTELARTGQQATLDFASATLTLR